MVAALNSLIEIDEKGIPWISGANTKSSKSCLTRWRTDGARKKCIDSIPIYRWLKFMPHSRITTSTKMKWMPTSSVEIGTLKRCGLRLGIHLLGKNSSRGCGSDKDETSCVVRAFELNSR